MADELVGLHARVTADAAGFKAGLDDAARSLQTFGAQVRTQTRQAQQGFASIGASWQSLAGTFASVGVTLSLGALVNDAKNFEQQMGAVRAITRANTAELRQAEVAIRRTGQAFGVGANAAAGAAQELLRAGVSLDALSSGALDAAVVMAQATGGTYAEGATIAAKATQVFRLEAEDMNRVVQGAAGVINATHFELTDYNLALQQGGAAARNAGIELEDFNALLALTAQQLGSSGSDTGTAGRTFLSRLVPQSAEAEAAMRNLRLEFYTTGGQFIGLEQVAERLRVAFAGLTDEQRNANLVTIFGVDAQRQAIALMEAGAAGVNLWRTEVMEGANAAEMAAARTQGFAGALANLRSEWNELAIVLGTAGMNQVMTGGTNYLAGVVRNVGTGLDGVATNGNPLSTGMRDPAVAALVREGRRRSGRNFTSDREALDDAMREMNAQEVYEFLQSTEVPNQPDDRPAGQRRYLADTYLGRRLSDSARQTAEQTGQRPRGLEDQYAAWLEQFNAGWVPPADPNAPTVDPTGGGDRERFDPDGVMSFQERLDRIARESRLGELERYGREAARDAERFRENPPIATVPVLVDVAPFTREVEIIAAAQSAAKEFEQTIESAWVNDEWDWSAIKDSLQRSWRQMLWDVFVGDQLEVFMRDAMTGVGEILAGSLGQRGGQNGRSVGGPLGFIGTLFSAFGGFFADGGTLGPGQWGIAGENGPEPIYGGQTGMTVFPGMSGDGGGAGEVHINVYANDAVLASELRAEMAQAVAQGVAIARQGAAHDRARSAFQRLPGR